MTDVIQNQAENPLQEASLPEVTTGHYQPIDVFKLTPEERKQIQDGLNELEAAEKKKTKAKLPDGITQEMLDAAKQKHGEDKVSVAFLPLDDDGTDTLPVIISVPSRPVIGEFEKWSEKNPNKAKEILVNACLHSSKDRVKADDNLFFTCVNAIADLIPIRKAIIKKF